MSALSRREAIVWAAAAASAALARSVGAAPTEAVAGAPAAGGGPFTLPPLPYSPDALEPHLDAATMTLHHDKHHATYVAKLNEAIAAAPGLAGLPLERLLGDLAAVPEAVRGAVRNHGGGHLNHSLFWTALAPHPAALAPDAALRRAIAARFGTPAEVQAEMQRAGLALFGSGWVWLAADPTGALAVETTPNQDSPISAGRVPLLGLDVWEHAYYLRYQNRRADYLAAIWNVVDWTEVDRRYRALAA